MWREFGDAVAPLSNPAGRPTARTLKLIVDPLIVRPVQNPTLSGGMLEPEQGGALADRLRAAEDVLAATAAWFLALKRARRALAVTAGNPQDLYFQRCFELATVHGHPTADGAAIAEDAVLDVHRTADESLLAQVRSLLSDRAVTDALGRAVRAAWAERPALGGVVDAERVRGALDAMAAGEAGALGALVEGRDGSAAARRLEDDGAARALGLTTHDRPAPPAVGGTAAKRDLPRPFDRSVYERLFADLSSGSNREVYTEAADLVDDEIARSAGAWQLAHEESRVLMLLGAELARGLEPVAPADPGAAQARLRARWEREAYVRRAQRLPAGAGGVPAAVRADIEDVHRNYLRRLWARLHGREIRERGPEVADAWDVLDGVLRSVIMDQRHRLRRALTDERSESA
ncbi:hypothetical protein AXK60_20870 [Tsukamurella pseudospumae]|uniref:Uncharacterized protein n=1 Tax=Tsukamurella pseudospumae TaxID=239498 RepID=A0A138AV05_9ACTN|nr:hypothetical protein AXK60_20870 [Tsukamurella pseudospumae]